MTAIQTALIVLAGALASTDAPVTVRVGPDPCPVPAEAAPYIPPGDVSADPDADIWVEESMIILKDVELGRRGLFGRMELDMWTGLPEGVQPPETPCEE